MNPREIAVHLVNYPERTCEYNILVMNIRRLKDILPPRCILPHVVRSSISMAIRLAVYAM